MDRREQHRGARLWRCEAQSQQGDRREEIEIVSTPPRYLMLAGQVPAERSFIFQQGNPEQENARQAFFLLVVQLAMGFSKYFEPVFGDDRDLPENAEVQQRKAQKLLLEGLNRYPGIDPLEPLSLAEATYESGRAFMQAARAMIEKRRATHQQEQ
jgi:hypothetical protein